MDLRCGGAIPVCVRERTARQRTRKESERINSPPTGIK